MRHIVAFIGSLVVVGLLSSSAILATNDVGDDDFDVRVREQLEDEAAMRANMEALLDVSLGNASDTVVPNPKREFALIDGETVLMPLPLPKMKWKQKEALLIAHGHTPEEIESQRRRRKQKKGTGGSKKRRALNDNPWIREHARQTPRKQLGLPEAAGLHHCPAHIDAVTQGHNHRTYVFAGEYVYQIFRDRNGLTQKAAYLITEMFSGGPRRVNAALTNQRSSVTVLVEYNNVYRFRWSKKSQRFYLARKSPQRLDRNVTFVPRLGFQWTDGNMILSDGNYFVTYDPYWNIATFIGINRDYFPEIPRNAVGVAHSSSDTFLWLNNKAHLSVYDLKKFRIDQEYPVRINDYVACVVPKPPTPAPKLSPRARARNDKAYESNPVKRKPTIQA